MGLVFKPASMDSSWHLAAIKVDSVINPTPNSRYGGAIFSKDRVSNLSGGNGQFFFSTINFASHVAM
jgi:hypothetical protein